MGRPREFDLDEALDRAMDVFWRKGYDGATLLDLTRAMRINRPSLYAAFGDKQALYRKALDRYAAGPARYVLEALAEPTARAVAERLFRGTVELVADPRHPRGCLLVQGAPDLQRCERVDPPEGFCASGGRRGRHPRALFAGAGGRRPAGGCGSRRSCPLCRDSYPGNGSAGDGRWGPHGAARCRGTGDAVVAVLSGIVDTRQPADDNAGHIRIHLNRRPERGRSDASTCNRACSPRTRCRRLRPKNRTRRGSWPSSSWRYFRGVVGVLPLQGGGARLSRRQDDFSQRPTREG